MKTKNVYIVFRYLSEDDMNHDRRPLGLNVCSTEKNARKLVEIINSHGYVFAKYSHMENVIGTYDINKYYGI